MSDLSKTQAIRFLSDVKITPTEVFVDGFKIPSVRQLEYQDGPGQTPGLLTLTVLSIGNTPVDTRSFYSSLYRDLALEFDRPVDVGE